jgi:diaminopimelate decarboxylase
MHLHSAKDLFPVTSEWNESDLRIGGCSVDELAREFDTPLYIYDETTLRQQIREITAAFAPLRVRTSYSAKACAILQVLRVCREEGLDLDVVSAGELAAGMRAGFSPNQIHLHGNYKTDDELEAAARAEIHTVVADSLHDLARIAALANSRGTRVSVALRLRLGLEPSTHPYLTTTGRSSKFGIDPEDLGQAAELTFSGSTVVVTGVHAHLGSQITDAGAYAEMASELLAAATMLRDAGLPVREIGVGGGWAVGYWPGDQSLAPRAVAQALHAHTTANPLFRFAVEPGRAIVARSAVVVYRTGAVKPSPRGRLIAVDGGMGDNPRPALYGARYYCRAVARPFEPSAGLADVVGRYCESGDVLASRVPLPIVLPGDLLCTPVAGAYQLSMASAYNLVPQPAAIMVQDGDARIISRRSTLDDLFARDVD